MMYTRLMLLVACWSCSAVLSARDVEVVELLKGRWEGNIEGRFRSQEVSWHFDLDEHGELRGFMGPMLAGMPSVPMQDLRIEGDSLSFRLEAQHASYEGVLENGSIRGIWQQGTSSPLQMRKRTFAFALREDMHAALLGNWQYRTSGREIWLRVSETANGLVSAVLDIPASNMLELPVVEFSTSDDGSVSFATDNGRRFTGNLVEGVLFGEYRSPDSRFSAVLIRENFASGHLEQMLSEEERSQLNGSWLRQDRANITLTFRPDDAAGFVGELLIRGSRRADPMLVADVRGSSIVFVTAAGRSFTGTLEAEEMSGQYRSGFRPTEMNFNRVHEEASE